MTEFYYFMVFISIIIVTRILPNTNATEHQYQNSSTSKLALISNSLSGKELKVVIGQLSVASIVYRNESGYVTGYGGYLYEELKWISTHLHFSLGMEVSKDNTFGVHLNNGSYTGIFGQLQRGEVDIACSPFSGTIAYEIVDLAIYVTGDGVGILARYPIPHFSNFGHVMIFSPNVWIGLLVSITVCIGFMKLLIFVTNRYLNSKDLAITFSDVSMYMLASLTNHGSQFGEGRRRAVKMIVVTWCFSTFCFVNIYSSCLTSYLSLTFQRPEINTFHDLATNPKYQMTTLKGITAETIFLESKSGTMKEIGDKLRHCHDGVCVLRNIDETVQKVLHENNFVAILPLGLSKDYIFKTMVNRNCKLTMGQETMAYRHYFMGVPKRSPLVMELNKAGLWYHAFGLQDYWRKKLIRVAPQCMLKYNSQGENVKLVDKARLKLEQFYVPFAVLFTGYVLALIQFLRERFIRY